ncbi:response regulator transcription factor [Aliikangiella coralliicola]|uniref:Response regulator transcription factor n=1 Tax=Aliikangiella coralliicola TaxID=2592383 RepID=A0A545UH41_9GAMM|nr:response regulator transcription factor [Aliikangiella coralliicola]TQV88779.1 response regulator transcription factor [Aliikangiella coralliicola]
MIKLLIVDDDIELCQLLQDYLSQEGFFVDTVHNGLEAIKQVNQINYDLLILDVMMPQKNGFETLTEIRQDSQLPVIMLTARGEKVDRIVGLEMGADDYVAKPCDPRELVARIRAVTRRTQHQVNSNNNGENKLINHVSLDQANRQVTKDGQAVELTSTEFDLLKLLMENAGKLVTRETISETCLGKKLQPFDRSIDMHLSNVRKKLGDFAKGKPRIKTIRGNGYQYLIWSEQQPEQ